MTKEQLQNELLKLAKEELSWKELPTGSLRQCLDSIQRMELIVAIEDHFLICFDPEDEEKIDTVSSLVHMIFVKLGDPQ